MRIPKPLVHAVFNGRLFVAVEVSSLASRPDLGSIAQRPDVMQHVIALLECLRGAAQGTSPDAQQPLFGMCANVMEALLVLQRAYRHHEPIICLLLKLAGDVVEAHVSYLSVSLSPALTVKAASATISLLLPLAGDAVKADLHRALLSVWCVLFTDVDRVVLLSVKMCMLGSADIEQGMWVEFCVDCIMHLSLKSLRCMHHNQITCPTAMGNTFCTAWNLRGYTVMTQAVYTICNQSDSAAV